MESELNLPQFTTRGMTVVYENPRVFMDGIVMHREATIEIDASKMRRDFLLRLMWHMSEGHVRVKIARQKEQS